MTDITQLLEKRRGNTGVWMLINQTARGTIIAMSEWDTEYEFDLNYWLALPVIPEISGLPAFQP